MPRLKRKLRERAGWDHYHRKQLLDGSHYFFGEGIGREGSLNEPLDVDRMKRAWEELRTELMAKWIKENPCTRPYAWWRFDSPERRRCTSGVHPFHTKEHTTETARIKAKYPNGVKLDALSYGTPQYHMRHADKSVCQFEIEPDYLKHFGLLTEGEAKLLRLCEE